MTEHRELCALRTRLGIKQLWQFIEKNGKLEERHILLNGSAHFDETHSNETITKFEVRDDDGVTVLQQLSARELFDALSADVDNIVPWPDEFSGDANILKYEDEALENYSYPLYGRDEEYCITAPTEPFFKALGVPLFHVSEGDCRDRSDIRAFHPQLVLQWRDLVDLDYHVTEAEKLAKRIRERLGESHKRPRVGADHDILIATKTTNTKEKDKEKEKKIEEDEESRECHSDDESDAAFEKPVFKARGARSFTCQTCKAVFQLRIDLNTHQQEESPQCAPNIFAPSVTAAQQKRKAAAAGLDDPSGDLIDEGEEEEKEEESVATPPRQKRQRVNDTPAQPTPLLLRGEGNEKVVTTTVETLLRAHLDEVRSTYDRLNAQYTSAQWRNSIWKTLLDKTHETRLKLANDDIQSHDFIVGLRVLRNSVAEVETLKKTTLDELARLWKEVETTQTLLNSLGEPLVNKLTITQEIEVPEDDLENMMQ